MSAKPDVWNRFLNVDLLTDHLAADVLLGKGLLFDFWSDTFAEYRSDPKWGPYRTTDVAGRIRTRRIKQVTSEDFEREEMGSWSMSYGPDYGDMCMFVTANPATASSEAQQWMIASGVAVAGDTEAAFLRLSEDLCSAVIDGTLTVRGVAGPGHRVVLGPCRSAFFELAGAPVGSFDYATAVAGMHWLNIVQPGLLGASRLAQVEELGADLTLTENTDIIRLTPAPTDLTDELVAAAMAIVRDITIRGFDVLPGDWWRHKR